MRGTYIKIYKGNESYNKDLMDATFEERKIWYNTLIKEQIISVMENFIDNELMEERRRK